MPHARTDSLYPELFMRAHHVLILYKLTLIVIFLIHANSVFVWFSCVFFFSNHYSCIFVRTRAPRRSTTSKSCLWRLRRRICVKCAGCVPQKWRDARTFDLVRRWHGSGDPTIGRRASVTRRTAPRSRVPRYGCIAISCPSRVPLWWSYNACVSGPYPITFGGCDVVEWHTNCNWFVVNKKNILI